MGKHGVQSELTARRAAQLKHRKGLDQLFCYRCGQVVLIGQGVHVTLSKRVYHQSCWDSLFLDS